MQLNLGSGDRYVDGWVNVDLPTTPHRKDVGLDLTSAERLPWSEGSVECVYAGHVLEHLALDDCRKLLARLRPLMIPAGPIMLVGPDVNLAEQLIPEGAADQWGATRESLRCGAGRWAGDVHLWECTGERLAELLTEAGWSSITPVPIDEVALLWPVADPRPRWQCAVGALAL